jgi:hypothetical protein
MFAPMSCLCMQVGYNLVLKKLQGLDYAGSVEADSPGEAFTRNCSMWELAGAYGQRMQVLLPKPLMSLHLQCICAHVQPSHPLQ